MKAVVHEIEALDLKCHTLVANVSCRTRWWGVQDGTGIIMQCGKSERERERERERF